MTAVEERLRQLRAATGAAPRPSPQLLGRIRESTGRRRRLRDRLATPSHPSRLAGLAMAALAVVVAAALAGRPPSHHQPAVAPAPAPARPRIPSSLIYQYAVADPGARQVTLVSADGMTKVPVVVLPDGSSVLGRGDLPVLRRDRQTYQLWGIVGYQEVSLRLVGANPDFISFTTPPNVTMLFMTVEDEGGVVSSTKVPVVSGVVNSPGDDGGAGDWLRNGVRNRVV